MKIVICLEDNNGAVDIATDPPNFIRDVSDRASIRMGKITQAEAVAMQALRLIAKITRSEITRTEITERTERTEIK